VAPEDWQSLLALEATVIAFQVQNKLLDPEFLIQQFQIDEERQQRGMPPACSTGLPFKNIDQLNQIFTTLAEFLNDFLLAFDTDWDVTRNLIYDSVKSESANNTWFGEQGTFAHPKIDDVSHNWPLRGRLISNYAKLLELLHQLEGFAHYPAAYDLTDDQQLDSRH